MAFAQGGERAHFEAARLPPTLRPPGHGGAEVAVELEAQAAEHTKARLALEAELTCSRSEVENLRQRVAELAGELRSIQTDSESEHAVAMASLRAQLDESLAREANTAKLAREEAARLREEGKKLGEQRAAEAVRATVAECQATSEPRPAKPSPALSRL